jgi:hypothetical protein
MKKIAVFLNGEKSCFMTSFNGKKTKEIYSLTHLELLQTIFGNASADLWIVVKKPELNIRENIEYCQVVEALAMCDRAALKVTIGFEPKNKEDKIKALHEILNTTTDRAV